MSLSQNINSYIDDTVSKYIRTISTKYNLDYESLLSEWKGKQVETKTTTPKVEIKTKVISKVETKVEPKVESKVTESKSDTSESLMQLSKQDLQERCRKAGVRSSGTKNELVKYLLEKKPKTVQTKMPEFIKQNTTTQEEKKTAQNTIVKKISSSQPVFNIRRNKFNNYEDLNTGFVFNNLSKKVIGKQNSDGSISELTKEDINICNKYKFQFVIPSNLDKNTRTEDVKVEELDEEEEDVDDGAEGGEELAEEEVEVEVDVEVGVDDEDVEDVDDDEEEELLEEEEDIIEDEE
jgi:hypothetical protein